MIDHAESVRNFYRKQGAATEQQRIIELLNQSVNDYLLDKLLVEAAIIANAIALIKGESQNDNESVVILTEGETNE